MEPHDREGDRDDTAAPPSHEELAAFASALQQEVLPNPPIRCGISFHWNGSHEDAERCEPYPATVNNAGSRARVLHHGESGARWLRDFCVFRRARLCPVVPSATGATRN